MEPIKIGGKGEVSQVNESEKSLIEQSKNSEGAERLAAFNAKPSVNAESILKAIAPSAPVLVEEKEINVGGIPTNFFIKRLSYAECSKIDAKKSRKTANGAVEYNHEYAATVGLSWHIHSCVVRNANEGKIDPETDKPMPENWVPMFTLAEVQGDGMMNNPDPAAKIFVYELINAIWEVNSELSFLNQAAAAAQLGTQ